MSFSDIFIIIFLIKKLYSVLINIIIQSKIVKKFPKKTLLKVKIHFMDLLYFIYAFNSSIRIILNSTWIYDCSKWIQKEEIIPNDIEKRYFTTISYYLVSLMDLFDESRSDQLEMFIHHIFTLHLLLYSISLELYRYGIIILALHDISDPFLELSKIGYNLKFNTFTKIVFFIFTPLFIITRIIIYPRYIIYTCYCDLKEKGLNISFIGIILSLICLFIMHLFWTWKILLKLKSMRT
ncbi:hypothetical protein NUSPORA_01646 [Nucleospora cyclopteri]